MIWLCGVITALQSKRLGEGDDFDEEDGKVCFCSPGVGGFGGTLHQEAQHVSCLALPNPSVALML